MHLFSHEQPFLKLEIHGNKKIGLWLDGPLFLPFLKNGFSFATLEAFESSRGNSQIANFF